MNMTPELVELIDKAIDAHGNVTQLAKSMGIAHSTVLFWKSGKTKRISGKVWANKVRPALAGFMTGEQLGRYMAGSGQPRTTQLPSAEQAKLAALVRSRCLKGWDSAIESLEDAAASQGMLLTWMPVPMPEGGLWVEDAEGLIEGLPPGARVKLGGNILSKGPATAILAISGDSGDGVSLHFGSYRKEDAQIGFRKANGEVLDLKRLSSDGRVKACIKVEAAIFQ